MEKENKTALKLTSVKAHTSVVIITGESTTTAHLTVTIAEPQKKQYLLSSNHRISDSNLWHNSLSLSKRAATRF